MPGPEAVDPDRLLLMLNSLLRGPEQVLPPVNWAGVLSPFMKLGFGEFNLRLVYNYW